jgi:DnaK suppressor protein
MVSKKTISELRHKLLEHRREILEFRRNANASWQTLHEPEKELEESASKETMSRGLQQLDDRRQEEVRNIDNALTKMEENEYGICEACHRSIAIKRLRAVPWARFCVGCAAVREGFTGGQPVLRPVSPGKEELTDEEMQDALYDALQEDGRVEMEELNLTCEDGVVYLEGVLPSEGKHEILLEIVNDMLDFNETVDNITIDRQPWERRERTPEPGYEKNDGEIATNGKDDEIDVHESFSTGEPMMPPDKLTPEERRSGNE